MRPEASNIEWGYIDRQGRHWVHVPWEGLTLLGSAFVPPPRLTWWRRLLARRRRRH